MNQAAQTQAKLIMTVGETMVAVAPSAAEPLEQAQLCALAIAGAESNVAQYLADAGVAVAWAGKVGQDPLGKRILTELSASGVSIDWAEIDETSPTGVMFKNPAESGTTVHYYRAGSAASTMSAEFAQKLPWKRLAGLHLTGITPALSPSCDDLVDAMLELAASYSVPVSFDVNYRKKLWSKEQAAGRLLELAQRCELVFLGLDEAQSLWPELESADDVRKLIDLPARLVVKDGAIGATEFFGQQKTFVPARKVAVLEAVGAGDAFAAGYLAELYQPETFDAGSAVRRLARGHEFAARALTSVADFSPITAR